MKGSHGDHGEKENTEIVPAKKLHSSSDNPASGEAEKRDGAFGTRDTSASSFPPWSPCETPSFYPSHALIAAVEGSRSSW